MSYLLNSF